MSGSVIDEQHISFEQEGGLLDDIGSFDTAGELLYGGNVIHSSLSPEKFARSINISGDSGVVFGIQISYFFAIAANAQRRGIHAEPCLWYQGHQPSLLDRPT